MHADESRNTGIRDDGDRKYMKFDIIGPSELNTDCTRLYEDTDLILEEYALPIISLKIEREVPDCPAPIRTAGSRISIGILAASIVNVPAMRNNELKSIVRR